MASNKIEGMGKCGKYPARFGSAQFWVVVADVQPWHETEPLSDASH